MKLKLFFLGMFAAAAFIGCNNEPLNDGPNKGPNYVEGIPVYASVNLVIENGLNTYAGGSTQGASAEERAITGASMYVYKFDGVSTIPEAAIYVAALTPTVAPHPAPGEYRLILKATSGPKKIFVAINPAQGANDLIQTPSGNLTIFYDDLNNPLYSTGTTWSIVDPATQYLKADGLIRGLAKGDIYGDETGTYSGAYNMFMANWDGPDDWGVPPFNNTCTFDLVADIDSADSYNSPGTGSAADSAVNNFNINVQRSFAKISAKITANAGTHTFTTTNDFSSTVYAAGETTSYVGEFQPWTGNTSSGVTTAPVWSLGNIHKETLPFQKFEGGFVRDLNYLALDDSITKFTKWTSRYDNTRVFPTTMTSYPMPGLTVNAVKDMMRTNENWSLFTDNTTSHFAYAIENARLNPVTHDYGTYIILGGRYNPARIMTSVTRATIETNPPTVTYNNGSASDYAVQLVATDTMYYIPGDGLFILNSANLVRYYAWVKKEQFDAPADGSGFLQSLLDNIQDRIDNDIIYAYAGGQCWYRVFISDALADAAEENAVRRNHIYSLDITKIKGPGISDPNKILIPGKPIPELDTYVTANIRILDWHQVDQVKEVDMN